MHGWPILHCSCINMHIWYISKVIIYVKVFVCLTGCTDCLQRGILWPVLPGIRWHRSDNSNVMCQTYRLVIKYSSKIFRVVFFKVKQFWNNRYWGILMSNDESLEHLRKTLEWPHMSVMASEITGNLTTSATLTKRHIRAFCERNPQGIDEFPHNRPEMRKTTPCHDVTVKQDASVWHIDAFPLTSIYHI